MQATEKGFNSEYAEDAPTFAELSDLQGSAIVEFGTPWCSHCLAAKPAVELVLTEYTELPHIKVYDGKGKILGREFKVKQWPTFVLLKEGKELDRLVRPTDVGQFQKFVSQLK